MCYITVYLSHVRKYGGVETRLMAYMEYLIISVMVQANSSRGKPRESCEGGSMYRISQVTYTLEIVGYYEKSVDHSQQLNVLVLIIRNILNQMNQCWTHLDQTCCTVTCTLDLTRPSPACNISSRAPVCNKAHC